MWKDAGHATTAQSAMKSLATVLLIFVTCLAVAGTMALIDRAQATLTVPFSRGNE